MKLSKKLVMLLAISAAASIAIYIGYKLLTAEKITYPQYPLAQVEIIQQAIPNQALKGATLPKQSLSQSFKVKGNTPKQAPIYNYDPKQYFSDTNIGNITRKLGVNLISDNNDPVLGRTIIASKNTVSLTIYVDKGEFYYTDFPPPESSISDPKLGSNVNINVYRKEAENFIGSFGADVANYEYTNFAYLSIGGAHAKVVDQPRDAEIIELLYKAKINGYPLIDKKGNLSPNIMKIWLSKNLKIRKAQFQAIGKVKEKMGMYPIKTSAQIAKDVENQKPILISGSFQMGENVRSIVVNSAELAYFAVGNKLIPTYILEASVFTGNIKPGKGYLFLEAVDKDRIK